MTKIRAILPAGLLLRAGIALLLLISPLAAQQQVDRAHQIGGKFMCMCSCNQVLTQCNHVGCTTSTAMLKQIDQAVARGDSEDAITQAFVQEFGTQGLCGTAAQRIQLCGLEHAGGVSGIGLVLVLFIITRWRKRPARTAACIDD